jgi:hypothetical protein
MSINQEKQPDKPVRPASRSHAASRIRWFPASIRRFALSSHYGRIVDIEKSFVMVGSPYRHFGNSLRCLADIDFSMHTYPQTSRRCRSGIRPAKPRRNIGWSSTIKPRFLELCSWRMASFWEFIEFAFENFPKVFLFNQFLTGRFLVCSPTLERKHLGKTLRRRGVRRSPFRAKAAGS